MFEKVLIANRGEIACRIARTARRLGISSVAVYSDADVDALHVELADEAYRLGAGPAGDSYLCADKLIDVARRSGAQAIHPGYGFLSENADFAQDCADAGFAFVGPSPQAIRLMGSKATAKQLMAKIGVPVLPGYQGDAQDAATFAEAAARLGYPVLVKAAAGGGGRGMRIVRNSTELPDALEAAAREALVSFGNARLLIETYLPCPRHIEQQIFADANGEVVTFPARDCSAQRRRQKVVEETPAPATSTECDRAMRDAAVAAARASGYVGAGTIEFLMQDGAFYFLEMNTRLQVEHPVSEMICGVDLVEWQFRVATGEPLPLKQAQLKSRGAAIEARICAEDPTHDFMPATGVIEWLRFPPQDAGLRIDTGVREGNRISPYYDSLLAKLVVWGEDRAAARRKLQIALDATELVGISTNLDLLRALARDARFENGAYDTGLVEMVRAAPPPPFDENVLLASGAAVWLQELLDASKQADAAGAWSPWSAADGWRHFDRAGHRLCFAVDDLTLTGVVLPLPFSEFELETQVGTLLVRAVWNGNRLALYLGGVRREVGILRRAHAYTIVVGGRNYVLRRIDPLATHAVDQAEDTTLAAPLPARVTRVFVGSGDQVEKGAPLVALEAMKMEITLTSPREGRILEVACECGQAVAEGAALVHLGDVS